LEALNEGDVENGEQPQRIDVETGEQVNMSATGLDDTPNEAAEESRPENYNRQNEQTFDFRTKFTGTTQNPFLLRSLSVDTSSQDTGEINPEATDDTVATEGDKNWRYVEGEGIYVNGRLAIIPN
jgi:hypothetical protein